MNRVEELIEKFCPEGVEYKKISDICSITRGRVMSKDYLRENLGDYPVYSSQTADNGILGSISTYDFYGEYLSWTTDGANAGTIFYRKGKFSITNVCGLLKVLDETVNIKFLFYTLGIEAPKHVNQGMGNPKLMSNVMADISIPIPPLPIQEAIVKILDNFSSLTAELQAELQARKSQYEFYRDQLLTFDREDADTSSLQSDVSSSSLQNGNNPNTQNTQGNCRVTTTIRKPRKVKWMKLGDVGKILRGKRLTKSQLTANERYPVFHGGIEPLGFYGKSNRTANTVMVINVGASAGTVGFSPVDFWSSDGCFCIEHSNLIKDRFLYYTLLCKQDYFQSKVRYAGIPTLDNAVVEDIEIPIPPLTEQQRIVSILDRFDTLINDISTGLPAEIAARQQQYEYYRDKLLTFKRKEA